MSSVDFILNIVGLLLWFNWRGARFDPINRTTPATLTGTLRRAEPRRFKLWLLPLALIVLLAIRALFYCQLGPAVAWTPALDLGAISLSFRSDRQNLMFLFSALSFLRVLIIFYFWLIFLVVINRNADALDPLLRLLRLHLGLVGRWPWPLQLIILPFVVALAWAALHSALANLSVINPVRSYNHLVVQGLVLGGALLLSLKYIIPLLLFLYLIGSYVYFGRNPLWEFIHLCARSFLAPISRWPLQVGKVDFAPLVGIVLGLLRLHAVPNYIGVFLDRHDRTIWPQ